MSRLWHAHPVLAACAFVVNLWSSNLDQGVSAATVAAPLIAVAGAAAGLAGLLAAAFRSLPRGAMAATATVVFVFGYGQVRPLAPFIVDGGILLGWTLAWVVALALIAWRPVDPRLSSALSAIATVVIVLNVVPVALHGLAGGEAAAPPPPTGLAEGPDAVAPDERPDIYYLIFDRYPSAGTLLDVYGFDNAPFLEALEARGFFVADHSFANYPKTALSVASSLDMDYLDRDRLAAAAAGPTDWTPVYDLLGGSLTVPRFLHSLGYTYVNLPSWFEPTGSGSDVDVRLTLLGASEFASVLYGTTIVSAVQRQLGLSSPVAFRDRARELTLFQLERLVTLDEIPAPRLVFAHILLPHDPFVFDRDGTWISEAVAASRTPEDSFIHQVQYANTRILDVVDRLQAATPDRPPVIVLQADEGPFPERYVQQSVGFDWTQATIEEYREKYEILNAYSFPTVRSPDLHESITPVNSFRALFRAYFDADIPLIQDRAFVFVDELHLYDLFEITDLLGPEAADDPSLRASYDLEGGGLDRWTAGETRRYAVTVTNLGDSTWMADGPKAHRLGVNFGAGSERPGDDWATDKRFRLPRDVGPGESVAVRVAVTAPDLDGSYVLRHRVLRGAHWSSDIGQLDVAVVSTIDTWEEQLSARYDVPLRSSWDTEGEHTVELDLTNTGSYTWNAGGERLVRLSVSFGSDSDAPGDGWVSDERFQLRRDVPPGASTTMHVTVTAPAEPGDYTLRYRLVKENVAWFDELHRARITVDRQAAGVGWPHLLAGGLLAIGIIGAAIIMLRKRAAAAVGESP